MTELMPLNRIILPSSSTKFPSLIYILDNLFQLVVKHEKKPIVYLEEDPRVNKEIKVKIAHKFISSNE